ncbi:MAG: EutN/CcmL family microcompartment protein [Melioribacteraceae bacterium]|nr:EutN/CcmL family microcompartment protein [Melioribacteraceae bacterium]
MILAKVKGNIVSTQKNKHLVSEKLLLVQPIDLEGKFIGNKDLIVIDNLDAGIGDRVMVTQEGDAVQQILGHKNAPVHSIIVGIIDGIDIQK